MGRRTNEELWKSKKAPRSKGEGTVFEVIRDGRKTYRAVRKVVLKDGDKPVQISGTGSSEAEAIARREARVVERLNKEGTPARKAAFLNTAQVENQSNGLTAESPFADLLFDWLKWKRRQNLPSKMITKAVWKQYETHARLHLAPSELGATPIGNITRNTLNKYFFETLMDRTKVVIVDDKMREVPHLGVSNRRAQQGMVNQALQYAVSELRILDINPAASMERIPKDDYRLANENLERKRKIAYRLPALLDGHEQEARWMVSLLLGLRQSEVLGLDWEDSFLYLGDERPDRQARVIVKQQLVRDPFTGELSIEPRTKSKHSTRIIPIDPELEKILIKHKENQKKRRKAYSPKRDEEPAPRWARNLVFTHDSGHPISHQTDHKRWRALLREFREDLGGDEVRLHALRHFAASILISSGAGTVEEAKQMLGHSSTVITTAVYLHTDVDQLVEPTKALTHALFRDRDAKRRGEELPPYDDEEYEATRIRTESPPQ